MAKLTKKEARIVARAMEFPPKYHRPTDPVVWFETWLLIVVIVLSIVCIAVYAYAGGMYDYYSNAATDYRGIGQQYSPNGGDYYHRTEQPRYDDLNTRNINEGAFGRYDDLNTPGINEGAVGRYDDLATPDVNERLLR